MNTDPAALNPIGSAVSWLQGTLLGSVATATALIAVASVGYLMLTGRIDVRRAIQVVFGCFILFGASSIAQGVMGGINGFSGPQSTSADDPPLAVASPPPVYPQGPPAGYDPYAGAAVPVQQ